MEDRPLFSEGGGCVRFVLRCMASFVRGGPEKIAGNPVFGLFSVIGDRISLGMASNETDGLCKVGGMRRVIFYGNYTKQLRMFCRLCGVEVMT